MEGALSSIFAVGKLLGDKVDLKYMYRGGDSHSKVGGGAHNVEKRSDCVVTMHRST